jgi:hypothetical protein
MRILLLLSFLATLTAATCKNKKSSAASNCYKGRLAIQAACMNYTISLEQGNIDTSLIASRWTDETTGKTYKNVFALGSRCTFPSSIKEGDEFYFTLDSSTVQNCAVCLMYYPVPPKKLSIKVIKGPCN